MGRNNKKSCEEGESVKTEFQNAVEQTSEISKAYCKGLQALKSNEARLLIPANTRNVDGSVDIDAAVKAIYPNASRWDYVIGYSGKICFVEVHPAYTSEVQIIRSKFTWLKQWVKEKAPLLDGMPKISPTYIWIQSGKGGILPGSRQAKELAKIGLKPISYFKLV